MKKIIVQMWALSLLLLNATCTLVSQANIPTYTLTPPIPNVWNLDIYSNKNLNTLLLEGPHGESPAGDPSFVSLINAINQTAQMNAPVVARFFITNDKCAVQFSQNSITIATYAMPTTNRLLPFARLQPCFEEETRLDINIHAIAQAEGTIIIQLHIKPKVTTPTYSLDQQWTLDIYTNSKAYAVAAVAIESESGTAATSSLPATPFFNAMNASAYTNSPIVAKFTLPSTGGSVVTFTKDSQILGKYTLQNGLISYFLFSINDRSKNAQNKSLSVSTDPIDPTNTIGTICQAQGTINIRFHPNRPIFSTSFTDLSTIYIMDPNNNKLTWIEQPSNFKLPQNGSVYVVFGRNPQYWSQRHWNKKGQDINLVGFTFKSQDSLNITAKDTHFIPIKMNTPNGPNQLIISGVYRIYMNNTFIGSIPINQEDFVNQEITTMKAFQIGNNVPY